MEKVYRIKSLSDDDSRDDMAYWLSRPMSERFAAVETLRLMVHDPSDPCYRLQKVVRIRRLGDAEEENA